jgi:hypothetical protein
MKDYQYMTINQIEKFGNKYGINRKSKKLYDQCSYSDLRKGYTGEERKWKKYEAMTNSPPYCKKFFDSIDECKKWLSNEKLGGHILVGLSKIYSCLPENGYEVIELTNGKSKDVERAS